MKKTVKRFLTTSLSLALVATVFGTIVVPQAEARDRYGRQQSDTLLVAPDGSILDYVPEQGEVIVSSDNMGRRILLDRRGNLLATEVAAETYFPQPRRSDMASGGGPRDYRAFRSDTYQDSPDVTTGSISGRGSITRMPLEEQPLPGIGGGSSLDTGAPEQNMASASPSQSPSMNDQQRQPVIKMTGKSTFEVTAMQVFLDREGISPGVIDGHLGDNVNKAVAAWQQMTGETIDPNNSEDILGRLRLQGGLPVVSYTITAADAAGPYVASIPEDYAHKAALPELSYTSTTEALAERFHMDEGYLKSLNPGADFTIPGTIIKVVDPGPAKIGSVARIVADKGRKQVFAYDAAGNLVSAYPASIGSSDTPSPSGQVTVERVALNPGYTYNPKINFQQGANDKILNIPPGPNGPVGTVWIALSKPTYGIHGTPEPSKIGRTQSHGCIRLANWDATELAKMVKPGVTVEFIE
jgi:lipoprotein-anchoring transpeptidase ErfK/SrfK